MAGVNSVTIIGNLGNDPEVRYMPQGGAVANITVATSESWTDKQTNEKKEQTEWHKIVFYGRLAEVVGEYLRKGSKIYVQGKLKTRKWTDQQGVERYTTEIIGNDMQMLSGRPENQGGSAPAPQGGYNQQQRPQGQQQAPRNQPPMHAGQQQGGFNQPQQQAFNQPQQGAFNTNQQRGPMEPPIDFDDDIPF